jgi:hypothetical protein
VTTDDSEDHRALTIRFKDTKQNSHAKEKRACYKAIATAGSRKTERVASQKGEGSGKGLNVNNTNVLY